jgi:hypothetical protein
MSDLKRSSKMNFRHLTAPLAAALLCGCSTNTENVGAGILYAPLIIASIPVYGLSQGWRAIGDAGAERVYPPAGLTKKQISEQIDLLPGGKQSNDISLNPTEHSERWIVRKGSAIVYVQFKDGITVEYPK